MAGVFGGMAYGICLVGLLDVAWREYEKDGEVHRVAIECKNYNQKIPIGRVRDFFGVLYDIGNIKGIMACKEGYQDGAKKFADFYGHSSAIEYR